MKKKKLAAHLKYLRSLYVELEAESIATKDGIAKARYQKAANYSKAAVDLMIDASERSEYK